MDPHATRQFREYATTRGPALLRTGYALTGHQQAAEDLVQEALARAAARWGAIRGDPDPYVRRVMYHQQVSWWRRRGRIREEPTAEVPERAAIRDAERGTLHRLVLREALLRLAPRQRAVLVLRFLDDLSERQVADILDCTPSTVASQTSRALARLRTLAPELDELREPEEAPS